jgi:hypothetical protein
MFGLWIADWTTLNETEQQQPQASSQRCHEQNDQIMSAA